MGGRRPEKPTNVKILNFLQIFSSCNSSDRTDDVFSISVETGRQYFVQFCKEIIAIYGETYLRRCQTKIVFLEIEKKYKWKWFRGCVGSIDCSNFFWKNCPTQDKGQYLNSKDIRLASIQCEACYDGYFYCCHWNVRSAGTKNYTNLLMSSCLMKNIFAGLFIFRLPQTYLIIPEGAVRLLFYILGDSIYPDCPLF